MDNKYFEIVFKNDDIDFSSEFSLLNKPFDNVIAEDLSGNKIIIKKELVYLFIHDAPIKHEYVKLFDTLVEFYSKTYFYDDIEQEKKYNQIIEGYEPNPDFIPEKKVLISSFIKQLGIKRMNPEFKEDSYYNVTLAFHAGSITRDEFELFRFAPY